jgi:hypothetical protein
VRAARAEVVRHAPQVETWAEIEDALTQFEGPEGFVGPCELLVATAWA